MGNPAILLHKPDFARSNHSDVAAVGTSPAAQPAQIIVGHQAPPSPPSLQTQEHNIELRDVSFIAFTLHYYVLEEGKLTLGEQCVVCPPPNFFLQKRI